MPYFASGPNATSRLQIGSDAKVGISVCYEGRCHPEQHIRNRGIGDRVIGVRTPGQRSSHIVYPEGGGLAWHTVAVLYMAATHEADEGAPAAPGSPCEPYPARITELSRCFLRPGSARI